MLIASVSRKSEEAADNVVELELLEAMFLLIYNPAWSKNVAPGLVSCVGIPWFWQSFYNAQSRRNFALLFQHNAGFFCLTIMLKIMPA